ncbi:DNA cytosine methyltransferase [Ensifer sp. SL37]|uniref:DNA cytosine methyltransferase n=1 Tax=Ensifer sp. SL37 TaxID=2995137 RepID=UPI0022766C01|nr:DNA (cytosine-5-)-methyltransferase [Ensifer sp. SL37]MCY1741205.1 DNA (cytosine-5-)-methyltransferase [Ensifer sp. SL37]
MSGKLRVLDLFSGIGGFSLGLETTGGFETIGFCEINEKRRVDLAETWPGVPIYTDVRSLTGSQVGRVDVITGGFPCQDISTAGKKAGIHGERSGLFSEIVRLIRELRPKFVLLENSADLLTGADGAWARHVFGELSAVGYDAEWHVIPASGLGAPHERERVYIIASDPIRTVWRQGIELFLGRWHTRTAKAAAVVAYDYQEGKLQSGWRFRDQRGRTVHDPQSVWPEAWDDKLSQICGLDDGLPAGLATDTSERFGNSVVPHIPKLIGHAILEIERIAA